MGTRLWEVISSHYWFQFTWKIDFTFKIMSLQMNINLYSNQTSTFWGYKVSSQTPFGRLSCHWPIFVCMFWNFTPVSNVRTAPRTSTFEVFAFQKLGNTVYEHPFGVYLFIDKHVDVASDTALQYQIDDKLVPCWWEFLHFGFIK